MGAHDTNGTLLNQGTTQPLVLKPRRSLRSGVYSTTRVAWV
jgi:hypothetical protein